MRWRGLPIWRWMKGEEREEVARSMVRSLVRLARQRGFRRVIVELPESWDTAVRMYKQMGFYD